MDVAQRARADTFDSSAYDNSSKPATLEFLETCVVPGFHIVQPLGPVGKLWTCPTVVPDSLTLRWLRRCVLSKGPSPGVVDGFPPGKILGVT